MDIVKYKYKAHRFINNIFYFIFFFIGFVLGLFYGFTSNVTAYTIYSDDKINVDEEFIYNTFSKNENFNLDEYSYILCSSSSYNNAYRCIAMNESLKNNLFFRTTTGTNSSYTLSSQWPNVNNPFSYFSFYYRESAAYNTYTSISLENINVSFVEKYVEQSNINFFAPNTISDISTKLFSNFENVLVSSRYSETDKSTIKYNFKKTNVLDFEQFKKLEFNKDLFENDENFKKICVEPYKNFAITRNDNQYISNDNDFLWMPYHLAEQMGKQTYNLNHENKLEIYTADKAYLHYNFNSKFSIDTLYGFPPTKNLFPSKGYSDKYKYFGWYAYPFSMTFTEDKSQIIFDIFSISSTPSKVHMTENGVNHGGGGHRLDEEGNVIENNITENGLYCFYIKNEYSFQYVNVDEYGDFFGTVETPGGNYDFETTYNKDNFNSSNSFSTVSNFISSISSSLSVVRDFITSIFDEFPLILKSFIISIFIILLIFLIIKMVVK